MSFLSLVANQLIEITEHELANATPVIADIIVKEIDLLIAKLESLLAKKGSNNIPGIIAS